MSEQQASYRQIMKATSIFGGVQVFQILIQIIRSKFVAIYLGPAGMGIYGLLMSAIGLIASITNFGLGTSAVKNIAEANATGNEQRISTVVTVMRRLVWITGLIGALITAAMSYWLSVLSFGNADYTWSFVWISITLLFNQLSSGQMVILQGMRKLQLLAKANLYGAVTGLLITIPLYYKYKIEGIVPVIILIAIVTLFFSWYFSLKIKIEPIYVSKVRSFALGKQMLQMGFMISLSGLFSVAASYLLRIFIAQAGTVADVGLYNAGFTIISTYVGLIFNAMGTDYYPRLAAVAGDKALANKTINQQADIALLILAPIVIIFLVFINWFIILLYSTEFTAVNTMIYWTALGMFFRAPAWTLAYMIIAKGNSRLYFWSELIANIYSLLFNILGYYIWGLTGLGISFLAAYVVYLVQVYLITKIKFQFTFSSEFVRIFSVLFSIACVCFIFTQFVPKPYSYFLGSVGVLFSTIFAYFELNKRLNIASILKHYNFYSKK